MGTLQGCDVLQPQDAIYWCVKTGTSCHDIVLAAMRPLPHSSHGSSQEIRQRDALSYSAQSREIPCIYLRCTENVQAGELARYRSLFFNLAEIDFCKLLPCVANGELEPVWVCSIGAVHINKAAVANVAGCRKPLDVPPPIASHVQVNASKCTLRTPIRWSDMRRRIFRSFSPVIVYVNMLACSLLRMLVCGWVVILKPSWLLF